MNCFGNAVKRSNEAGNHQHHHQGKDESSSENIVSQAGPSGEVNKKSRLEVLQRDSKKSVNPITSTSELENDVTGNGTTNGSERPPQLREFTLAEMKLATKNFHYHNVIGEGGFGKVYKGVIKQKSKLHDGELEKVEVAVKQLNNNGFQGHKEWMTEVTFLVMVDNPYLVKLIGYCAADDERGIQRLLVYEFMPNRGLDDHIFRISAPILSWQTRVKIALGAAKGLAYLHEEMEVQVIFRDFKTSNVLLDEDYNPKLSDFGLARLGPEGDESHVTTGVKGTQGYAAPEYVQTGHLTSKSDVYSFGVVMLEMLTGRRALDCNRPRNEQRLQEWMKPYMSHANKLQLAIDPQLEFRFPPKAAQKFCVLASQCIVRQPKGRPKMSEVVEGLTKVLELSYSYAPPISQSPQSPQSPHPNHRESKSPRIRPRPPVRAPAPADPSDRSPLPVMGKHRHQQQQHLAGPSSPSQRDVDRLWRKSATDIRRSAPTSPTSHRQRFAISSGPAWRRSWGPPVKTVGGNSNNKESGLLSRTWFTKLFFRTL